MRTAHLYFCPSVPSTCVSGRRGGRRKVAQPESDQAKQEVYNNSCQPQIERKRRRRKAAGADLRTHKITKEWGRRVTAAQDGRGSSLYLSLPIPTVILQLNLSFKGQTWRKGAEPKALIRNLTASEFRDDHNKHCWPLGALCLLVWQSGW